MATKEFFEVIFLFSYLDSLVINDQVISNHQLVMRVITKKSCMDLLLLNIKLLTDLFNQS